jgi:O-acetyl-ADP-ribose deacetylase (regulator of RNase III)
VSLPSHRIEIHTGDITQIDVDAIVNAANTGLRGGGGVDGAIHRAAGPGLLQACIEIDGCPTGSAVLTPGFNLRARFVIHTPGPVWQGGQHGEQALLASCYRNSLEIAVREKFQSLAFPGISTGIYGYPKEQAAVVAWHTVTAFLESNDWPARVLFVCYDHQNYLIYRRLSGHLD